MHLKSPYGEVPPSPEMNVHHLFFHRPEQADWKDYPLQIDAKTGKRRSFHEFLDRVELGMTALGTDVEEGGLGFGTQKDDEMIGILSPNSMDYIVLVNSLLGLATPFVPISCYSTPFELKYALELSRCTRLFVNVRFLALVLPVAKKVGISLSKIYILGGKSKGQKTFSGLIADVRTKGIKPVAARSAVKDTLAFLIFSSGTTGRPKAVMISHGNIIFTIMQAVVYANAIDKANPSQPSDTPVDLPVALGFLPLHHVLGLYYYAFRVFFQPQTLVLLKQWDIEVALKAIPKYKVTQLLLVPSIMHQIVNYPNIRNVDFSSLQTVGSGGAYLPSDLLRKMTSVTSKDLSIIQGFGMSECTISALGQPMQGALGRPLITESTGILLPGQEARIVREDGTEAEFDEMGELYLRGGNVVMGYWHNEKATRETFTEDGWLKTGDQFRADKDGNFFFVDRLKDTLKISGAQVSPVEIEDVLLANPQGLITDVTVAGVSGGRTSDEKVPRAWIVLSEAGRKVGVEKVKAELETWHQENLSKYKHLRGGIEIVKEIPKSPTGKVLKRVLQDKFEEKVARRVSGKL